MFWKRRTTKLSGTLSVSLNQTYKDIGVGLDRAFKQNVESHEKTLRSLKRKARDLSKRPAQLNLPLHQNQYQGQSHNQGHSHNQGQSHGQSKSQGGLAGRSIIWTPDHGYIEPGSQRFGLNQDPKEMFWRPSDDEEAEEAFAAYLDLKESRTAARELLPPPVFLTQIRPRIRPKTYMYTKTERRF